MAIEPSSVQRDRMLSHEKSKLGLAQFLVVKDPASIQEYFTQTRQAVVNEGGAREHELRIDQTIAGGKLPYQFLTVDSFPSSQALLLAHENTRDIRCAALQEIYSLYFKSNPTLKKVIKGAGIFSPTLTRWLGTQKAREIPTDSKNLDPETDPELKAVREFSDRDLDQPFWMMNLNHFSARNKLRRTGKDAYNSYSARILPYLISVGGYPEIYARILGTYIGDQGSSLANSWEDFALVHYPSRSSFLRLMTNTPERAAAIRRAGLENVVLMTCLTDPSP